MNKFPLQPIGDRVIIEPDSTEKMTPGGVIIPDTATEKPQFGTIIAIGRGRGVDNYMINLMLKICEKLGIQTEEKLEVVECKVGDRVMFGRYGGDLVDWKDKDGNEKKFLFMRIGDIAAVINE